MPACKSPFRFAGRTAAAALFFCLSSVCAQSGASVPSVKMPSMPSVAPPAYPPVPLVPSPANSAAADSRTEKSGAETAAGTQLSAALTASALSSLGGQDTSFLNTLLGADSGISSLTGVLAGTNAGQGSAVSTALLQQIIAMLSDMQKQNAALPAAAPPPAAAAEAVRSARILRFRVNGYDILGTCRTVYFSDAAQDGSFLLTADRRYLSDGKTRDETFYLLFKKTGDSTYEIAADVLQDYLNEYSFLYQLAGRSPVTGERTGNMIVVRVDDPLWKLDLLIDASGV